jgi:hypothetical protein
VASVPDIGLSDTGPWAWLEVWHVNLGSDSRIAEERLVAVTNKGKGFGGEDERTFKWYSHSL